MNDFMNIDGLSKAQSGIMGASSAIENFYTQPQLIEYLGRLGFKVTPRSISKLVRCRINPLPYSKPFGERVFPKDEFHAWLREKFKIVNKIPCRIEKKGVLDRGRGKSAINLDGI